LSKPLQSLFAIPLGGLGEFGMNMMALRYGDDIIVIDAGMMFPSLNCWAWTWSFPTLRT